MLVCGGSQPEKPEPLRKPGRVSKKDGPRKMGSRFRVQSLKT